MNFELKVPIFINEKKCEHCKFRFQCWTENSRVLSPTLYEITDKLNRAREFRATFSLPDNFLCSCCDSRAFFKSIKEQPIIYFDGIPTSIVSYEVERSVLGDIQITFHGTVPY